MIARSRINPDSPSSSRPKLPPGTYDLTLRSKAPDGTVATSQQRVTAALQPRSTERPAALVTPDMATVAPSEPGATKPAAGAVVVETVEIEPGGKFHVSGQARPGAALRLYLNDSFVTSVTAGADGRFAVTINEGVAPGNYRVRLDEASSSGTVRARAEVPFTVPETTASVAGAGQAPGARLLRNSRSLRPQGLPSCRTVARRLHRGRAEDNDHYRFPRR